MPDAVNHDAPGWTVRACQAGVSHRAKERERERGQEHDDVRRVSRVYLSVVSGD